MTIVAKPVCKWVGGKTALLPEILPRLPAKIDTYYEPFIGGGAVFFALAAEGRFKRAVISDTNSELIRTYRALAVRPLDVIKILKKHVYDEGHYYVVRGWDPSKLDDAQAAARFIYLNRTCFPPGAQVLMENEEVAAIENVPVGAKLWGGRRVKERLRQHYSGPMTALKVQGLPAPIRMTADHPILRIPKRKGRIEGRSTEELTRQIELAKAGSVEIGDYVLIPRFGVEREIDWASFWPREDAAGPQTRKRKFAPNDKLIARFLGYYLADGYTRIADVAGPRGGRGGQVSITTCTADWPSSTGKESMIRDIAKISAEVFDTPAKVRAKGGRAEIAISSVLLARFLEHLVPGQTWAEDPAKRHTKRLHPDLLTAPVEVQREILYGWMLGDGGLRVRGVASVELFGTTVIQEVARQMYRIAVRCGFSPTWRISYPNGKPTQIVTLGVGEEVRALGFKVPKSKKAPGGRRKILKEYIAMRVTDKTAIEYDGTVWNLEVDGDHLLCVDGVVSHNCFNGLYRVNKKGLFNVPFGKYTNPTICDEDGLLAVSKVLREKSVDIVCGQFDGAVATARPGDAIYNDPPYWPVSATANFTAYSAGGFGPLDQVRLRDLAKSLASRGVHVLLSNADVAPVRDLYASKGRDGTKFKIEQVEAPRRVNSKASKRGNVGELLITGVRR